MESTLSTPTGLTALPAATPAVVIANRAGWSGARIEVQASTTLTLSLPAPTAADSGHLPTVTVAGLPAPHLLLLPDGAVRATLTIPSSARGMHTLVAHWSGGQQGILQLMIGNTALVAAGLGEPDDLTLAPDGSILYTDLKTNTVGQLLADGSVGTLIRGLNIPEGLAVTASDSLLIADQGTNRVLRWSPTAALHVLLQLPGRSGVDGIDGLGTTVLGGRQTALLPDSATGRMLLLSLDTGTLSAVAGSWQRPTDATMSGGQLYLVDEYGGRLWRGPVAGPLQPVGPALDLPDDVAVAADGTAFVNDLGQGSTGGNITQISPTGSWTLLLGGLTDPQGLALDGAGNLILAESGAGSISAAIRTCLPLLLGAAHLTLKVGGPAMDLPLASDCASATASPTFSLAPGAEWPAQAGTSWPTGNATTLHLANGAIATVQAAGQGSSAVLEVVPPSSGSGGTTTVAAQMHVGQQVVARQITVTVNR